MNQSAQIVINTALQTAAALVTVDPKAAAVVALAPVIAQLLDSVEKAQAAGTLTPDQLQSLFASIAANVKSAHDEWAAMNATGA